MYLILLYHKYVYVYNMDITNMDVSKPTILRYTKTVQTYLKYDVNDDAACFALFCESALTQTRVHTHGARTRMVLSLIHIYI